MMKKWKNVVTLCLAGSMLLPMTAGAGEELYYSTTDYFPICAEPIQISIAGMNSGTPDWNQTELLEQIELQMGIKMEGQAYEEDAWATQKTLILSSDELPDMFVGMNTDIGEVNSYGEDGYFLPLNEYLDIMPTFSAYLEAHPDYKAIVTAPDGNIYGLTKYEERQVPLMTRCFINKVWLDNLGLEVPTTADELYNVLKAFKEQDANGNGDPNDEIPLSDGYGNMVSFLQMFGIFSNDMAYSPIVDENGTVQLGQATDNYKAALTYLRKLYEEGIYDPDALVQTSDEFRAKCAEDRIGMMTTGSAPYVEAGRDQDYDDNWEYLGGLTSETNDTEAAVYRAAAASTVKLAVSADTEYPEAICRFIDWLYTEEGATTARQGFVGISWNWVENSVIEGAYTSKGLTMEEIEEKYPGEYSSGEEYRYKKATINEAFNVRGVSSGTTFGMEEEVTEEQLWQLCDEDGYVSWSRSMEFGRRNLTSVQCFPTLPYSTEDSETRTSLVTDIKMYTEQAFGQFITGELDIEADWDTYVNTLKQIGSEELIAIEQATYDIAYK